MRGGTFDYAHHHLYDVIEWLDNEIKGKREVRWASDEMPYYFTESTDVLKHFKQARFYIKLAAIYIQRIGHLKSNDDDEETFKRKLEGELAEATEEYSKDKYE